MRLIILLSAILLTTTTFSQRWHIQYGFKIGAGKNFIDGHEKVEDGFNYNYQLGFTARVTRKVFILDLGVQFQYSPYFNSDFMGHTRTNTTGLNIPITAGVIMINKPLFKWNLQAGVNNSFVFKSTFGKISSEQLLYNPYQLSGIVSTGIEVGWFIMDIYYQPAITRMFKNAKSGFNHSVNLSLGLIF